MRPQGFAHAGFHPLSEGGAKIAAEQLSIVDPKTASVLDPCVGDGIAIKRIMDALGIPYENLCAVELAKNRHAEAQANIPGAKVIGPACFLSGVNRPDRAFTFVYCNAPYADEKGGGYRVETQFLDKVSHMVPIGAVLMMVVPTNTVNRRDYINAMGQYMRRVRIVELPEEHAPYGETLVIGYRANNKPYTEWSGEYRVNYELKEKTATQYYYSDKDNIPTNPEPVGDPFVIPPAKKLCDSLHKVSLTEEEIIDELIGSVIEREVSTPPPIDRGRPPLALTTGHNGILVASGQAPPVVTLRDSKGRMLEVPHLIRGVARKEQYIKSQTTEENEEGTISKTKTVISESVDLKMTVLLHTGTIINLNEERDARPIEQPGKGVQVLHSPEGSGDGGIAI